MTKRILRGALTVLAVAMMLTSSLNLNRAGAQAGLCRQECPECKLGGPQLCCMFGSISCYERETPIIIIE